MLAMIIISSIVGYLVIGGVVGRIAHDATIAGCDGHYGDYSRQRSECDGIGHHISVFWAGSLWPLYLPLLCGTTLGSVISTRKARQQSKDEREKLAHERKMAEAKAKAEQMKLDIRYLELQGVKASVPGLEDVAA